MQFISNSESLLNNESSLDASVDNYWRILDVNLAWIRQSDQKAYTIFTIYGISISLVFSNIAIIKNLLEKSIVVDVVSVIYFISSLIAIIYGFRCIQPNIHMKFPPSIVFFGNIASNFKSPVEYHDHSKEIIVHIEKMQQELCNQIYINSIIAHKKYNDLKKSITAFLVSLISLLMIVINFFIMK